MDHRYSDEYVGNVFRSQIAAEFERMHKENEELKEDCVKMYSALEEVRVVHKFQNPNDKRAVKVSWWKDICNGKRQTAREALEKVSTTYKSQ